MEVLGMLSMESLVQEFANVGFTLLIFVLVISLVRWLDRKVFNKNREYNKNRNRRNKW